MNSEFILKINISFQTYTKQALPSVSFAHVQRQTAGDVKHNISLVT